MHSQIPQAYAGLIETAIIRDFLIYAFDFHPLFLVPVLHLKGTERLHKCPAIIIYQRFSLFITAVDSSISALALCKFCRRFFVNFSWKLRFKRLTHSLCKLKRAKNYKKNEKKNLNIATGNSFFFGLIWQQQQLSLLHINPVVCFEVFLLEFRVFNINQRMKPYFFPLCMRAAYVCKIILFFIVLFSHGNWAERPKIGLGYCGLCFIHLYGQTENEATAANSDIFSAVQ